LLYWIAFPSAFIKHGVEALRVDLKQWDRVSYLKLPRTTLYLDVAASGLLETRDHPTGPLFP